MAHITNSPKVPEKSIIQKNFHGTIDYIDCFIMDQVNLNELWVNQLLTHTSDEHFVEIAIIDCNERLLYRTNSLTARLFTLEIEGTATVEKPSINSLRNKYISSIIIRYSSVMDRIGYNDKTPSEFLSCLSTVVDSLKRG